ncbi:MAG: hypothetical protein GX312_02450 [Candidatus Phytoplasma sp.]|nr:hypothetical protein [Phytoplasma sp.]
MKKEFLIIKTKDAVQYINIRKIIDVRINLTKEIIHLRYGIGHVLAVSKVKTLNYQEVLSYFLELE